MKKVLTLCIVHQHSQVLLGYKKRGFGMGKLNGFGGKVDEGESIEDAARREIFEEAEIDVQNLEKMGVLDFEFKGDPVILEVHVFKANGFRGEPRETEEMKPQWFDVAQIPFASMWPDDKYWFPYFINGEKFRGKFVFDGAQTLVEKKLDVVKEV